MYRSSTLRGASTLRLASAAVLVLAGGCAHVPASGPLPQMQPAGAFESAASFSAPAAQWPAARWWSGYGDAQLDALVDEALAGAPSLAAAAARLQRAESMTQLADSAGKPQVRASAAISKDKLSYHYLTPPAATPSGWNDYGRATLDFSWELDFWGKNRAALAAATSEREAARADVAQARLLLAAGVAAGYAELSRLYANRDTADKSVQVRRQSAALFAERFANGLETRGAVREADARRAAAEGALLALDEQIALQRNALAALLGAGPDRGLSIARPVVAPDRAFGLPAQLSSELLGRRPDVVAARLVAEAQGQRIRQAKAGFYPNVNLGAFLGVQALGLDMLAKGGSGVGSVGPAVTLPIFTAGRLQGQLRGAQASYAEAVANYHGAVARALQEVADAATSQKALAQRLAKAQEAVDAAGEADRVARDRYQGGLANYVEVLSAEDSLLASLNARTNLRAASLTLDIALQRALGGGYQPAWQ